MEFVRREVLILAGGGLAATFSVARAANPSLDDPVAAFTVGRALEAGRVNIEIAAVAENGFIVPVAVSVDSAMTETDRVEAVGLFAEANPTIHVATFWFSTLSADASVSTRIRLARTQTVRAVARMADGRCFVGERHVEVVIGGCGAS